MTAPAGWQQHLAAEVAGVLENYSSARSVWLLGSLGVSRGAVDPRSDVDVGVVVDDDDTIEDWHLGLQWIAPVGRVWATDRSGGPLRKTTRVVFADCRRLDLIFYGQSLGRPDLPGREVWSRPSGSAHQGERSPVPPAQALGPLGALVNQFRFTASLAVVKLARADELIGLHLALECVRLCLVVGMVLRDEGAPEQEWSGLPQAVGSVKMPGGTSSALSMIEQSAVVFQSYLHRARESLDLDVEPLETLVGQLRARQ